MRFIKYTASAPNPCHHPNKTANQRKKQIKYLQILGELLSLHSLLRREHSSVGSEHPAKAGGSKELKRYIEILGAQLSWFRASALQAEGPWFEPKCSHLLRQGFQRITKLEPFFICKQFANKLPKILKHNFSIIFYPIPTFCLVFRRLITYFWHICANIRQTCCYFVK